MTLPRRVLPNQTYLITRRCLGRRFLLRPDGALTNAFLYCLAVASQKYNVEVHGLCAMSNHYHLIITDTEGVLPNFMAWLNRHLAMCVKRLRQWDEVVWEPNVAYSAVELTGLAEVLDKMAYVMLNPVSAALVRSPEQWPGALSTREALHGTRIDATRPAVWFRDTMPEVVSLQLRVPPCISERASYLRALNELLDGRLSALLSQHQRKGRRYLGRGGVRRTSVTAQPRKKKERGGRTPTFSALTRTALRLASRRLRAFRLAYRDAYRAWRGGDRQVVFPAGTWWVVHCAGATAAT
ncbi:MAG: transposase [Deltaproteobacteria bacterium]|jgi:REP element-mobilizing transposase RayT|nr:transposase [Deltaproteobacteria bacterium]